MLQQRQPDGYHLWSERYDRTLEDIFAVQDDIAQSVVKELRTTLLGEAVDAATERAATAAVAAAAKGRTTDAEAHRLYLQARYFADRVTREDTAKSIGYLKQAGEGPEVRGCLGGARQDVRAPSGSEFGPLSGGLRPGARRSDEGAGA